MCSGLIFMSLCNLVQIQIKIRGLLSLGCRSSPLSLQFHVDYQISKLKHFSPLIYIFDLFLFWHCSKV